MHTCGGEGGEGEGEGGLANAGHSSSELGLYKLAPEKHTVLV